MIKRKIQSVVADPSIVRHINKTSIMESVRDYQQEGVSRADIARMTDLSRATVSVIVDEFIARGLLEESGTGSSQGGRPPTYLRLNPRAGYVAAVDMGVSHMSATIANFNGESLAEMEMPFDITIGPERCLAEIEARLHELCLHAGCSWGAISAIAIGIPGPVLHESGMTILPPVMPNWDRFPIRQYLMDRWHKPIIVDNDADLAAMGEWTYIYKRREPNLAFVRIGTGIGAGLVLNRQLYRTQSRHSWRNRAYAGGQQRPAMCLWQLWVFRIGRGRASDCPTCPAGGAAEPTDQFERHLSGGSDHGAPYRGGGAAGRCGQSAAAARSRRGDWVGNRLLGQSSQPEPGGGGR
jgi:predicted transcriptional regulator